MEGNSTAMASSTPALSTIFTISSFLSGDSTYYSIVLKMVPDESTPLRLQKLLLGLDPISSSQFYDACNNKLFAQNI
eukprot:3032992-Ditylum_brightwellii.AAC.1